MNAPEANGGVYDSIVESASTPASSTWRRTTAVRCEGD